MTAPAFLATAGLFLVTAIIATVVLKLKQKEKGIRTMLMHEAEQRLVRFHPLARNLASTASAPAV